MSWKRIVIAEVVRLEQPVPTGTKPNQQSPAGRVCADPNCETVLSIYNKNNVCAQHGGSTVQVPVEKLFPELKETKPKPQPKTPASERRFDAPRGRRPARPQTQTFDELYAEIQRRRQEEEASSV